MFSPHRRGLMIVAMLCILLLHSFRLHGSSGGAHCALIGASCGSGVVAACSLTLLCCRPPTAYELLTGGTWDVCWTTVARSGRELSKNKHSWIVRGLLSRRGRRSWWCASLDGEEDSRPLVLIRKVGLQLLKKAPSCPTVLCASCCQTKWHFNALP